MSKVHNIILFNPDIIDKSMKITQNTGGND